MEQLWDAINGYVNVPYLFTFMLLAYTAKKYAGTWLKSKNIKTVYIVLGLATIIAIPYIFLAKVGWSEILFTYTLGTSLHELFFKIIENKLNPKDDKRI